MPPGPALPEELERELEAQTVALNHWLYDEGVGLPVDESGYAAPAQALARLYARVLELSPAGSSMLYHFALEGWIDSELVPLDQAVDDARDQHLRLPDLHSSEGVLTWRSWKAFEREAGPSQLRDGFERLVAASAAVQPAIAARLEQARALYQQRAPGQTPIHAFALREGTTPEALRALLLEVGRACRPPFAEALRALCQAVFGRPAGPAELRALYLNRMYEPTAPIFLAERAVPEALAAFRSIGFDLSGVPVDVELRPRKYPGAFCFPVSTPHDVRVSVRIASAHHLVDMLYHEFGHAVHFSGIRAGLPFVDRYWIQSGTHETFSTLFEHLLGEPEYLREQFGFEAGPVDRLMAFHRFKALLTGTWSAAAGLTSLEGWLEGLDWHAIERRYAEHIQTFTGVAVPPGFARLEPFVSALSIYPAGYVLAAVRVAHWLEHLRRLGGDRWWRSAQAQSDIRDKVAEGGSVRFPAGWESAGGFFRQYGV